MTSHICYSKKELRAALRSVPAGVRVEVRRVDSGRRARRDRWAVVHSSPRTSLERRRIRPVIMGPYAREMQRENRLSLLDRFTYGVMAFTLIYLLYHVIRAALWLQTQI